MILNKKIYKSLLVGFITGIINGLFGSGGGTIIVPSLVFLLCIEEHKAHATAISIILPITFISTFIYLKQGMLVYKVAIPVIIGAVLGGIVGSKLLNKIPTNILRKIFGIFMIIAAIRMVIK